MEILHDETDLAVGLSVTCSTSNKDDCNYDGEEVAHSEPSASTNAHFMAQYMTDPCHLNRQYNPETVLNSPVVDFSQYTIKTEQTKHRPNFYRQREDVTAQNDCTDYRYKLEESFDYRYRKEDSTDYSYRKEDSSDYRYRKEDSSNYRYSKEDSSDYRYTKEDDVDYRFEMEDNAEYRYKTKNYEQKTKHKHKRSSQEKKTSVTKQQPVTQKMQVCKTCGKTFKFQTSLLRHNNKVHFCRYQCGTCCRVFSRQSYLDVHTSKPGTTCYIENKAKNKKRQRR